MRIARHLIALALLFSWPVTVLAMGSTADWRDLEGNIQALEGYRGKWVVVNYWATWCPPCLEEIPELVGFHERHKDVDAVVLGVNYERIKQGRLLNFVDEYFITYPVIPVKPSRKTPFGRLRGLPTTFIIDPSGKLVAKQSGGITAEAIENFIARQAKQ